MAVEFRTLLSHLVPFAEWSHREELSSPNKQMETPPDKDNLKRYSEGRSSLNIRVTCSGWDLRVSPSCFGELSPLPPEGWKGSDS